MNQKTIKPAPCRRVREPDGTPLPTEGKLVTWSVYWAKLLKAGDVLETGDQPAAKKAADLKPLDVEE